MEEDFVALLDSPIHWVFNKSKLLTKRNGDSEYLSLVISGAASFIDREKEEIIALGVSELRRFYPASAQASLVHSLGRERKTGDVLPSCRNARGSTGEHNVS